MTYIRKLTFAFMPGLNRFHVILNNARIDDTTNIFFPNGTPEDVAEGWLNIPSLVSAYPEILRQIRSEAFEDEYYGGSPPPRLPRSDIPVLPPDMIGHGSDEEEQNLSSDTRIQNLISSLDTGFSDFLFQNIRDLFLQDIPRGSSETVRIVISTNYAPLQFFPIENTRFIQNIVGNNRVISIVFVPLIF
jgi:hypothetical protein